MRRTGPLPGGGWLLVENYGENPYTKIQQDAEARKAFSAEYVEEEHPRDEKGWWVEKGEARGSGHTDSPEFKKWFGDSVIVNPDGSPRIVYHASAGNFDEFRPNSHFGDRQAANERATSVADFEEKVVGRVPDAFSVYPVYLKLENPLRMPDLAGLDSETGEPFPDDDVPPGVYARQWEGEEAVATTLLEMGIMDIDDFEDHRSNTKAFEFLKSKGYDGIVYKNIAEHRGHDSWIVFDPANVKSAIAAHEFDPHSKSIKHGVQFGYEDQPRDEHNQKWVKEGGGAGRDAGTRSEVRTDSVVPSGAGPAGRPEGAAVPALAQERGGPAIGPATDKYISERVERGEYSPQFAEGLRSAISAMPEGARGWLEDGLGQSMPFPTIREVDLKSADVPDFVKSAMSNAEAATLNGYKILYAQGKIPTEESLTHELAHTAYAQAERFAPALVKEAEEQGEAAGAAMLAAAYKPEWRTKTPPDDEARYQAWYGAKTVRQIDGSVRRYVKAGESDITGSLELNLMIPSHDLTRFAKHLGLGTEDAGDQWHYVALYTALAKKHDRYLRETYRGEEMVTYRAGKNRDYANRLFGALRSKKFGAGEWTQEDEAKHPRDEAGRWTESGGEGALGPTREEMAEDLLKTFRATGGFTYDLVHEMSPTSGFVVGTHPEARMVVNAKTIEAWQIANFMRDNAKILAEPNSHVGGWLRDDGFAVLDVTSVYDDREQALELGLKHQQEAIFDLSTFTEIPVPGVKRHEFTASEEALHPLRLPEGSDGGGDRRGPPQAGGEARDAEEEGLTGEKFYSEDQPRDERGRWTETGGGEGRPGIREEIEHEVDDHVAKRMQQDARDFAAAHGFDPEKLDFPLKRGPTSNVGGVNFTIAAQFFPGTGRISIYANGLGEKELLAHEIQHAKFEAVLGAGVIPDVGKPETYAELKETDGFNDYTRAWWRELDDARESGGDVQFAALTAIDETLADIAREQSKGSWLPVAKPWKDLFEKVNRAYEKRGRWLASKGKRP